MLLSSLHAPWCNFGLHYTVLVRKHFPVQLWAIPCGCPQKQNQIPKPYYFFSVVLATDSIPDSFPTQNSTGIPKTSLSSPACELFWSSLFPSLSKELSKSNTPHQGSLPPPNSFWTLDRQPNQSFPLSVAHSLTWTKLYTELSPHSSQWLLCRLRTWSAHGLSLICCGAKIFHPYLSSKS